MAGCLRTMRDGEFLSISIYHTELLYKKHLPRYANHLYYSGLLDANQRDECLALEEITKSLIKEGSL